MSQIALAKSERIAALQRFGYSPREAEFLVLAGLHGGYFLRRHYGAFLAKPLGGTAAALIDKAISRGHVTVGIYANNTQVYHLGARPFYAALGQEDNRNRRRRQPATVKSKLMSLDFVLAHRDYTYLATEEEKLTYFTHVRHVDLSALPVTRYAGGGQVTHRYFVEKYPLYVAADAHENVPLVAAFCFVDEGRAGISAFQTFLERYANLFTRLREFQVTYVSCHAAPFAAAAAAFGRLFGAESGAGMNLDDARRSRMVAHFEARRLYDTQQWAAFDRARLIRYREECKAFAGELFDRLYAQWKVDGTVAPQASATPSLQPEFSSRARFSTYLLEHRYDFFGSLTNF